MGRTISVYVGDVDVDVSDILEDIDTNVLVRDLATRDDRPSPLNDDAGGLCFVRDCLMRGDLAGGLAALDAILFPRFHSDVDAQKAYAQIQKRGMQ